MKEKVDLYVPKTEQDADKLFNRFKQLQLDALDEKLFYFYFRRFKGKVGFCIRDKRWQVCHLDNTDIFDITIKDIDEFDK